jgi:8-oxo-dGTP pyrophosphatase MutT (NUDIX family)
MTAMAVDPEAAEVKASGGVVWRRGEDGVEIVIVHRPRYDDWSLPKGKLDKGETWERAALREGEELEPTSYEDRKGRAKVVRYWRMEPKKDTKFKPNDEVDEIRWLSPEDAQAAVSYPHDAELVREAAGRIG